MTLFQSFKNNRDRKR